MQVGPTSPETFGIKQMSYRRASLLEKRAGTRREYAHAFPCIACWVKPIPLLL